MMIAPLTKIGLAYPSRARPDLFKQTVENWTRMAQYPKRLVWSCAFDEDDATMIAPDIRQFCDKNGMAFRYYPRESKVSACNRAATGLPDDATIIILVSDDMRVIQTGWDTLVMEDFAKHFPGFDGAIWYPDGHSLRVNTLSVMGRKLYERFGYVYHPAFKSYFCDDYYQLQCIQLNALRFIDRRWFDHGWRDITGYDQNAKDGDALGVGDRQTFWKLTHRK